ncbi:MAG: hypothetical protein HQL52_15915 [Magnetococcales bacterium]|nr:hypothetical protein [Magnetococcales bacterium]
MRQPFFFPAGTYRVSQKLTPRPGQKFVGETGAEMATIQTDITDGTYYAFHLSSGDEPENTSGCEFDRLKFVEANPTINGGSSAIEIVDRDNVVIKNCVAQGYSQYGFAIRAEAHAISNPKMINNTVEDHGRSGSPIAIGLLVFSPVSTSIDSSGGLVKDNTVNMYDSATADGACCKIENFSGITIENNTLYRPAINHQCNSGALTLIGLRGSTVEDNTITSVDCNGLPAVSITSNQILDDDLNPIETKIRHASGVDFINNDLEGNTTSGSETGALWLSGDLRHVVIDNNRINAELDFFYTTGQGGLDTEGGDMVIMPSNIVNLTIKGNTKIGTFLGCASNKIATMTIFNNTIHHHLQMIPGATVSQGEITGINIHHNTTKLENNEPAHLEAENTVFNSNPVSVNASTYQTNHLVRIAADYVSVVYNGFTIIGANSNINCLVSVASGVSNSNISGNLSIPAGMTEQCSG